MVFLNQIDFVKKTVVIIKTLKFGNHHKNLIKVLWNFIEKSSLFHMRFRF